ncbi:hypothetical protein evm_015096 [Chilo suppressalis]|nr:hypothetical protein evm_015096 [Chilo suppressalis]
MDAKTLLLLVFTVLAVVFYNHVEAEFYFNYAFPKEPEKLASLGLECYPGRTVIKMIEKKLDIKKDDDSDEDNNRRSILRRSHMNSGRKEEYCKVCTCSDDGKSEHCSGRPAVNVNECMRITRILEDFNKNVPFEHTRGLAFRIRRDYIWHNDEIPYDPKSKCRRGHSYYTNNENANDTDIDVSSDIESLLDYKNQNICFYCVCGVHGRRVSCINRDVWFCHYSRYMRERDTMRDMYSRLFQQDRPTYFRGISWRLRRTMDDGIYDFVETGGDTLCCNHPDGHRRHLHNSVRNKLHLMRRKIPKENLMGGSPRGDYVDFIVNND